MSAINPQYFYLTFDEFFSNYVKDLLKLFIGWKYNHKNLNIYISDQLPEEVKKKKKISLFLAKLIFSNQFRFDSTFFKEIISIHIHKNYV